MIATHVTPQGRLSMDPKKWCVQRIHSEERHRIADAPDMIIVAHAWAVYPPNSTLPHIAYGDHGQAVRAAQRYAMFSVIPPEMVPDILRDNTTQEDE